MERTCYSRIYTLQILKTTAIELNVPIVITDTCKVAGYRNDFSSLPYYPNFDRTSYDPAFNACDVMLVLHRPEMFGVTVDVQGRDLRNVLTVGLEKNCQGTKGMVPLKSSLPSRSKKNTTNNATFASRKIPRSFHISLPTAPQ